MMCDTRTDRQKIVLLVVESIILDHYSENLHICVGHTSAYEQRLTNMHWTQMELVVQ